MSRDATGRAPAIAGPGVTAREPAGGDLPWTVRYAWWWAGLGGAGVVTLLVLHLGVGTIPLSPAEVAAALTGRPVEPWHAEIVVGLRLPRVLIAATAGAMLGVAGAHLQAVTRNVLADPGLVGVSAGAVLAVVVAASAGLITPGSGWTPVAGTVGALLAGGLVFWLGWREAGPGSGEQDAEQMVLNGILVAAMGSALVSVVLILDGSTFGTVLRWVIGTLHARSWDTWAVLWPWALVGLLGAALALRSATVLWCGTDLARAVGADLLRARAAVFLAAAVLAAGAVAAVGAVAFVGLTAAHLVRPLVGSHPARVVPLAALAGAGLLLGADLVASWATFTLPSQDVGGRTSLPTGAVTALIGGPLLLALVLRERR